MNRQDALELAQIRAETKINLCLAAAEAAVCNGDFVDADRLFARGLAWSEDRWGAQSAAVGLVLLSIKELYEKDGTERCTRHIEYRINTIFRCYFFKALLKQIAKDPEDVS